MDKKQPVRDHRQPGWFWASNEMIDQAGAELGPYGIAVYMALARWAGKDGTCYPSIATIAKKLGCSSNKVRESLKNLTEAGWIKIEKRTDGKRHQSNLYILLPPPQDEEGASQDEEGTSQDEVGVLHHKESTNKESTKTQEKDSPAKPEQSTPNGKKPTIPKPIKDSLFENFCTHLLGIPYVKGQTKVPKGIAVRASDLSKIAYLEFAPPITPDEIKQFAQDWRDDHPPDFNLPTSDEGFSLAFTQWRGKQSPNGQQKGFGAWNLS